MEKVKNFKMYDVAKSGFSIIRNLPVVGKRVVAVSLAMSFLSFAGCDSEVDDVYSDDLVVSSSDDSVLDETVVDSVSTDVDDVSSVSDTVSTDADVLDTTVVSGESSFLATDVVYTGVSSVATTSSSFGSSFGDHTVVGTTNSAGVRETSVVTKPAVQTSSSKGSLQTTFRETKTTTVTTTVPKSTVLETQPSQSKKYVLKDICYDADAFEFYACKLKKIFYPLDDTMYLYRDINDEYVYTDGKRECRIMLALLNSGRINKDVLKSELSRYSDYDISNAICLLGRLTYMELNNGTKLNYSDFTLDTDLAYSANEFRRMVSDYVDSNCNELYNETTNYFSDIDTGYGTYSGCDSIKNLVLGGMQYSAYSYKVYFSSLITTETMDVLEDEAINTAGSDLNEILNGKSLTR